MESRKITLRTMIQIRKHGKINYTESEILHMVVHLLRAVRDAKVINVSHGGINDENVFIGWGGRYKLTGFE